MSSIAMDFRAPIHVSALPADWVPHPLGPRYLVERVMDTAMQTQRGEVSSLTTNLDSDEEGAVLFNWSRSSVANMPDGSPAFSGPRSSHATGRRAAAG